MSENLSDRYRSGAGYSVTLGPVDSLDHASRLPNYSSKMGIDATRKWAAEGFTRLWPPMIEMDSATRARVEAIWNSLNIE